MTKCILTCDNEATADIQWHSEKLGTQQCSICQFHLDEMMERFKPLITLNMIGFRIGPPGSIVEKPS